MTIRTGITVLTLGVVVPLFAFSDLTDDTHRVEHANQVFQEIMQTPDKGIPDGILRNAQCLVIVPGEKTFAWVVGGSYGKGLATCRHGDTWSAPAFVQVGGASWGLQIGGESTDVVLVVKDRDQLDRMLRDKVKIGADATAVAGPVGREATADTDASMHAEILGYSRSRGAFAGVSLSGDVVQPDDSGNKAMYGDREWRDILSGNVEAPSDTRPLLHTLDRYTNGGSTR